jgi:serpin B
MSLAAGAAAGLAACSSPGNGAPGTGGTTGSGAGAGSGAGTGADVNLAMSKVARATPAAGAADPAAKAITGFTERMVASVLAGSSDNLVCSPYSVAAALAMTANGARDKTATEMLAVLGGLTVDDLDAGLAALSATFASRAGAKTKSDGNKADIALDIANSLWGQRGTTWEQPFLDALAKWFGAGMNLVDYVAATEAARARINGWTAAATHNKINDLLPEGALDPSTRLVLVNAVYLKAPWEEPFAASATQKAPFTLAAGGTVQADMMRGSFERASAATGPGYTAVSLPYAGGRTCHDPRAPGPLKLRVPHRVAQVWPPERGARRPAPAPGQPRHAEVDLPQSPCAQAGVVGAGDAERFRGVSRLLRDHPRSPTRHRRGVPPGIRRRR